MVITNHLAVINIFVKSLHCSDQHFIMIGDERE